MEGADEDGRTAGHGRSIGAELYDLLVSPVMNRLDLAFYLSLARKFGGPILELACGTGRVLVPCAKVAGAAVGVDLSDAMLDRARLRVASEGLPASAVSLVRGDIREVRLGATFPLLLLPGQPFTLMRSTDDIRATLETVRLHLAEGGRWASGIPVRRLEVAAATENRLTFIAEIRHPATGLRTAIWDYASTNELRQETTRRRVIETLDEEGFVTARQHMVQHFYYRHPRELQDAIRDAGFEIKALYGGFRAQPFGSDSDFMVWVATAA